MASSPARDDLQRQRQPSRGEAVLREAALKLEALLQELPTPGFSDLGPCSWPPSSLFTVAAPADTATLLASLGGGSYGPGNAGTPIDHD